MVMQADFGISRLMLAANGLAAGSRPNDAGSIARLASNYASRKLGLAPTPQPGAYLPVYETKARMVEEAVYETSDVVQTEGVFEERTITETRDIVETRPVYEERELLETKVEGTKRLTDFDSLSEADIETGSAFKVTVGDGPTATIKFASSSTISVTVGGATETFSFNSGDGSFRKGLLDALNSVEGLSASLSARGRLVLVTSDAQSLTIDDVARRRGEEWFGSPLRKLGLEKGTTTAKVVGYETVQTGTQDVVVGSEDVVRAVLVKVGEKSVVTGSATVMTGTVSRLDGYDRTLVGLVEPETYGAGVLGLLAEESSSLPADYVELLFGVVRNEQDGPSGRGFDAEVRAAYDETSGRTGRFDEKVDRPSAAGFGSEESGDPAARGVSV
jgi:hypothetical protein